MLYFNESYGHKCIMNKQFSKLKNRKYKSKAAVFQEKLFIFSMVVEYRSFVWHFEKSLSQSQTNVQVSPFSYISTIYRINSMAIRIFQFDHRKSTRQASVGSRCIEFKGCLNLVNSTSYSTESLLFYRPLQFQMPIIWCSYENIRFKKGQPNDVDGELHSR